MGGRWLESLIFIIKQGAGKRQDVDRQKIIDQVRVQKVQWQAQGQGRQWSEPGGLEKQRLEKLGARKHAG
jgi:hypothetical protein